MFDLTEADWVTSLGQLLGKVKKKIVLLHPRPVLCVIIGQALLKLYINDQ